MKERYKNFSREELRILAFLVRTRLRYESRRPAFMKDGVDVQSEKVWELKELSEKLEEMLN